MVEHGLAHSLGQQYQCQSDRSRNRLHEEDLSTGGSRAKEACDQDTNQKEDLDAGATLAKTQAPEKSGCQEAIVETLVGGQDFGGTSASFSDRGHSDDSGTREHLLGRCYS